jgi:D-cysteine desulfhydrase
MPGIASNISFPSLIPLAQRPTPIQKLNSFSRSLDVDLWIKRDDLTGFGLSGNKVRKLEFLLKEAKEQEADMLITCGAAQSNHARATAIAGARLGMRTQALLRGRVEEPPEGNLLLLDLVGAKVQWCSDEEYEARDRIMAEMADKARAEGFKPYVIPEGGSNGLGIVGYVLAMHELVVQAEESNLELDTIVCAVGTGGTMAGLCAGKYYTEWPGKVIGFNVTGTADQLRTRVDELLAEVGTLLRQPAHLQPEVGEIIDGYVGPGYALSGTGDRHMIRDVARREGVILDPTYTAKAFHGMIDRLLKKDSRLGKRILFWHTGGGFGLFPKWWRLAPSVVGSH